MWSQLSHDSTLLSPIKINLNASTLAVANAMIKYNTAVSKNWTNQI